VVCFSPRHDLSLASLGSEGIRGVVDLWIEQVSEDLTFQEVPIPPDVAVVVLDTGTCRGLVGSVYNERRETCRRAARALGVEALRDVDAEKLSAEGW
jgi:galactokinase